MKDPVQKPIGDWRAVFGALANEQTLRYYAQQVLGQDSDLGTERAAKARQNLERAGLIDEKETVDGQLFGKILAAKARKVPREGPQRFFDAEGRIERYPRKHEERLEMLQLVAGKTIDPGQQLTEAELTVRLEEFTQDTALLRRYLVDYGVLGRQSDGSVYHLVERSD
ncbi:DUF2087 domain-containing protein [Paeniglutamicibacter antarcticus]|uniref:DUF2087 domain-containing protein n=1 Tax=Paeniglutamicibacter antarcticus TaxID=494023 RepID=A0ABP9THU0_9MICC